MAAGLRAIPITRRSRLSDVILARGPMGRAQSWPDKCSVKACHLGQGAVGGAGYSASDWP